ncbi:class I SAM-dependent RNA methyltransferase [Myxosarcina sp. GI1]|uniref:THUMP domain-containing class I SAM-dependent RNA methyltransferase n=1 Tax=Myxosarcina sp. GI1 TaxID=1541065 RepID=UPI00056247A4|nr:class I SAM-dependent RNA methyltransferase [Myxosarcina sp. GI1]
MNNYFATVARGLEAIAAKELTSLGAKNVRPDFTGVHFQGDKALLYRVNLCARTLFRLLVPIAEVKSYNAQQLYRQVYNLNWAEYLQPNMTIAVNCTGQNQHLNHTHFTALKIKDAIVDRQRKTKGKRSSIDIENPDVLINAHINGDRCILSLDSSGSSLHRRGYHSAMGNAPLKETLASALLDMAEWTPNIPFLDPLCGSGTLPIEATLKALNIAPGLERKFGFQTWLDFDESLWKKVVDEAKEKQLSTIDVPIVGSDKNKNVIEQAIINAKECGVENIITLKQQELSNIQPPAEKGIIICNPPYGKRIGKESELGELYQLLGDTFKQKFTGWTAYILTGSRQLTKKVGLRTSSRTQVYNGAIPCTLLKYELY